MELPVKSLFHSLSETDLKEFFGDEEYKRFPDEIQRRYAYKPVEIYVEEHHIETYSGKTTEWMIKAKHPHGLIRNSLLSSSLAAGIINAKYANAMPLYRLETIIQNDGLNVTRKNMSDWVIKTADRYLSVLYESLHSRLIGLPIIQADETPVIVNKDGRDTGSKSYMWVYRSGRFDTKHPIILYEYQKTRKADHLREFLKDFSGVCITDGYQVYHTIESEREDLIIAGCWAHAMRKFHCRNGKSKWFATILLCGSRTICSFRTYGRYRLQFHRRLTSMVGKASGGMQEISKIDKVVFNIRHTKVRLSI